MSYNDRDYQTLAKAIVTDFVQGGCPLADSVVKTANDMSFNPHETRRLIEATNVNAHLTLFEKQAEHKYVEFDIVEPQDVLDRLFASPADTDGNAALEKHAADLSLELPDERWDRVRERIEKTAATAVPDVEETPAQEKYAGVRAHHAIQKINKVKDELETQLYGRYHEYQEKVARLRTQFRLLDALDFRQFEKDAYALFPAEDVDHPLMTLRDMMGIDAEKTASTDASGYVIERREHQFLKEAVEAYRGVREVADGIKWYQARADRMFFA